MQTFIIDAFASAPFTGNPAAVCLSASALRPSIMQQIAMEFGLSETAFVRPTATAGTFDIRYFSPKQEIPLCGHATLASACALFRLGEPGPVRFVTGEGVVLPVSRDKNDIVMDFPIYETRAMDGPAALLAALGVEANASCAFNAEYKIILVHIQSARDLATLQPDFAALVESQTGINGVLVTAPSVDDSFDFHYRYFWPWSGTNEDPVTGGVQTFLAKYWSRQLGKTRLRAFQSSARTGAMSLELVDDVVRVSAPAIVVLEGSLHIGDGISPDRCRV